ncbi:hypothetical protein ACWKWJ_14400 [Sphingopyxis terrae subsp. ummariensis]
MTYWRRASFVHQQQELAKLKAQAGELEPNSSFAPPGGDEQVTQKFVGMSHQRE